MEVQGERANSAGALSRRWAARLVAGGGVRAGAARLEGQQAEVVMDIATDMFLVIVRGADTAVTASA